MSSPTDENALDEALYALEFDGLKVDGDRSAAVVTLECAGFGLPEDIDEIQPRSSDEFEASGFEVCRGITELDMSAPESFFGDNKEFVVPGGVGFVASQGLFAGPSDADNIVGAPALPSHLRLAPTTLRSSTLPLDKLLHVLNKGFCTLSFTAECIDSSSPNPGCAFECSAMRLLSKVTFEVRIFREAPVKPAHLLECQHLSGCVHAFSACFSDLASALAPHSLAGTAPTGLAKPLAVPRPLAARLPPLDHLLPPPPLSRAAGATSGGNIPSCAPEDTASTLNHLAQLMGSPDPASQAMGCRALGALAPAHRNHFSEGGAWLPLAERALRIAAELSGSFIAGQDGELDLVLETSLAAVASVCASREVCASYLKHVLELVFRGLEDIEELPPHARRAILEAALSLSQHNELAALFATRGALPALEFEALNEKDLAASRFAQATLVACRA